MEFPMSAKKVVSAAAELVRFSVGANEIALADAARNAKEGSAVAFKRFYDDVIVAHDVPLSALKPLPKGETRSNVEAAAYDFGKRVFYVMLFGADITAQLYDKNVGRDTILPLSQFIGKTGKPYKDQAKHAVQASFGGTPWKEFVSALEALEADRLITAKVEAGEMTQADADAAGKRGAVSTKSDREYALAKAGELVKRMSKDVEKQDGSLSPDAMKKFAAFIVDGLAACGIK
jgi:hypothetical protein